MSFIEFSMLRVNIQIDVEYTFLLLKFQAHLDI